MQRLMPALTPLFFILALTLATPAEAAGEWMLSIHAGSTEVDHVVQSDEGTWWTSLDDNANSYGLGLTYEFMPEFGIRLLHERASGMQAANICPPGGICPSIAITESADVTLWSIAAMPRWYVGNNWSIYATAGAARWRLSTDGILPGSSDTEFTFGAGSSWLVTPDIELGLEYQQSQMEHHTWRVHVGWRFGRY